MQLSVATYRQTAQAIRMDDAKRSPLGMAILTSRGKYTAPKHILLIDQKLQELALRKIRRLAVFMPPRHAKSTMCSLSMPSWYLGKHPDHRVVLATHTANFAALWGRKVRDIVNEWGEPLFGINVRRDSKAANEWELDGHAGGMVAVGIGTALTGRGADLLCIDDPLADAEQALSPTIREKQWDWYCSVAETRLEPRAVEVVLATRWHPDDLPSRIVNSWKDSKLPYEVIRLPAIAGENDPIGRQPGEALWPERYDLKDLEEKRRKSSFWWDALYQQNPTPEGGAIFKVDWFKRFVTVDPTEGRMCWKLEDSGHLVFQPECVVFMIVDPALGKTMHGDDTAIGVFAYHQKTDSLLVLHMRAERIPVHEVVEQVEKTCAAWKAQFVGMEANGFQMLLAQSARRELGVTVRELDPEGKSKLSRAVPAIERASQGLCFLPDEPGSQWVPGFLQQCAEWTAQDGDKDDQVDCLAYAAHQGKRYGGQVQVIPSKEKPPLFDRRRGVGQKPRLFGQ